MSLHAQDISAVPTTTATPARAALRQGNRAMTRRDELGAFYAAQDFAALFALRGQLVETPWRLALLVFQSGEGLSDAHAERREGKGLAAGTAWRRCARSISSSGGCAA